MECNHTPGPWMQDKERPHIIRWHNHAIAQTLLPFGDDEKDMANARLISAAPDLLRACELLLNGERGSAILTASDACKKVKGERL